MELTIKNYKSCRGDEGDAFSCTLYIDGKRAALVRYDGNGGEFEFDFTVAGKGHGPWRGPLFDKFKAYVDGLPEVESSMVDPRTGETWSYKPNMDMVVEQAIRLMLENRQLKRWCKNQVLFRVKGDEEGSWRTLQASWAEKGDKVRAHLAKKYGDELEEIANERFAA